MPIPGSMWSASSVTLPMGTRTARVQVIPFTDVDSTMSLLRQRARNRQSSHTT